MSVPSRALSPPLDLDGLVVDLHTTSVAAASAAHALLHESSNASSEAGINFKSSILYTSSSESENEHFDMQRNTTHSRAGVDAASTTGGAARPVSPPPNCAICLGRCKNKCSTNSCVHEFCFKCLEEWSKVKAECPLCKQPFRSIIRNVKSGDQFEEHFVQTPTVQLPHSPLEVTYQGALRGFSVNGSRGFYNFSMRSFPRSHAIPSSGPITFRNYVDHDFGASGFMPPSASLETVAMRQPEFFRRQLPDEYGNDLPVSQLWRRYIYDRKLYALPISDITGRFRECSARYYRDNPGQIVRLIPFANRDLVCLLRNTNHSVTQVLETLNNSLSVSNILSRSFRRQLQPYLGERTAHFIHELSNFARSPFDMIGYDRNVQYATQSVEDQVIEFSSSGGEETNNNNANSNNNNNNNNTNNIDENPTSTSTDPRIFLRRNARRTQNATSSNTSTPSSYPPMSLLSFTITTTTEGSEAPGVSVAVSAGSRSGHAQVAAINLSTHNRAHNEVVIDLDDTLEINGSNGAENADRTATEVTNSSTIVVGDNDTTNNVSVNATSTVAPGSPQVVASIALSTSSSDECEFVLERKPPHLRTPEMVSLNSESDSDVVFVEETKPILAEATYSTSDEGLDGTATLESLMEKQEQQREQEKRENERENNELEASTSTGFRSRTLRRIVAAKRANLSRTDSGVPVKRRRTRGQRVTKAALAYSTDDSTTSDDSDDSDFASNKKSRRGRRGASSTSGKQRGSSNAAKRLNLAERKLRKRSRASNVKVETARQIDEQPDTQLDNLGEQTPQMQLRRRASFCNRIKSPTQMPHYSSETESSTEEDDKVNLKALQQRLKTSLSDIEANIEAQNLQESNQHQNSLTFSPQSGNDLVLKRQLNLATSFSPCDELDERPSTSAAAAAIRSIHTLKAQEESDTGDTNNEPNNAPSLRSSPHSVGPSASETNLRLACSSPALSTSSNSTLKSLQLPSTSQHKLKSSMQAHGLKFSARFKYSSSSDSTSDSSSSSSMTKSSATATSTSEDEL